MTNLEKIQQLCDDALQVAEKSSAPQKEIEQMDDLILKFLIVLLGLVLCFLLVIALLWGSDDDFDGMA
jgi:hypothetical protein